MKIFVLEKDKDTVNLLKKIIHAREIGEYISGDNTKKAIEEIRIIEPEIVIADLIFEKVNDINLIEEIKKACPNTHFIVISQTVAKEIIGMAYRSGAEYYITKPADILEIESVLERVKEKIEIKKKLAQIVDLLTITSSEDRGKKAQTSVQRISKTMQKLGILGESGSRDILNVINYLMCSGTTMSDYTVAEVCGKFSENPKTMEQRIRRAASMGMVNIANIGIEDYMNETFMEYSNGLYNFEQVKYEMDYIRKKSKRRGTINIKKFIDNMLYYAKE